MMRVRPQTPCSPSFASALRGAAHVQFRVSSAMMLLTLAHGCSCFMTLQHLTSGSGPVLHIFFHVYENMLFVFPFHPKMWEFPEIRGPDIGPKMVGLLLEGHPGHGPFMEAAIYQNQVEFFLTCEAAEKSIVVRTPELHLSCC